MDMDKGYEAERLEAYLKIRRDESHIQSQKEESEIIKNADFRAYRGIVQRGPR